MIKQNILELDALKYEEVELEHEDESDDEEVEWSWLDWKKISKIKDLDKELIIEHYDKEWDWKYLSRREDLPMDLVTQYPDWDWDWDFLSIREDLPLNLVSQYPDKDWNWYFLSIREDLPMDLVTQYPDKDWDWDWIELSKRKDLQVRRLSYLFENEYYRTGEDQLTGYYIKKIVEFKQQEQKAYQKQVKKTRGGIRK